ncbi:MAG: hypothetical protein D6704_10380 [Nitrospirae bacterium]|nr:MAG: hypothetical protein D6704_10380 [Nitrospirota bacterium]
MDAESLKQIREIVGEATHSLRQEFQEDLTAATQALRQEFHQDLTAATQALRQEFQEGIEEAKRHASVLFESVQHKLDLVIEGQQSLREQIDEIRSGMERESQETRALVRLSYQQLHQRVEALERRVEIIERHLGLSS